MKPLKCKVWVKEVYENNEFQYGGYMIEPHEVKAIRIGNTSTLMNGPTGTGVEYFVQGSFLPGFGSVERLNFEDIIILEYTGKNDMDGTEVYYKDIVEYEGCKYVVEWDEVDTGFYLAYEKYLDDPTSEEHIIGSCITAGKVIGNALVNPELLSTKL